jgi:YidC/Oxa1 family membrane protein insertase
MQKNLILAVVLSMALVTLWDVFVMRPLAPRSPSVQRLQGEASSAGVAAPPLGQAPETPPTQDVFLKTDSNLVVLSNTGASVDSWKIKANGDWVEMVLKAPGRMALSTFDETSFQGRPQGEGEAVFEGVGPSGVLVRKTFKLGPRFLHQIELEFRNPTSGEVDLEVPFGWSAGLGTDARALTDNVRDLRAIACDGPRVQRLAAGPHAGHYRWFGVDNKYFLAAFIPEDSIVSTLGVEAPRKQPPRLEDDIALHLKPGERQTLSFRFYLGPKAFSEFKDPRFNLNASENWGVFGSIAKVLFTCLQWLHQLTGNYGWAIIILTVILQVLLLPLTMHSYRHSVRMRELQPQIKALQERFKNDPKRMNVEVMNLYKKNGLKFMGMEGCFPMLLQIPFFYSFYAVLRNTYELRGAPWLGWIRDLSIRDPYYVLPILMGAGMLAQQKIGGAVSTDPAQARMMMFMPVVLTFAFRSLPSGYLLYWFTNSLATLAIQGWMRWRDSVQQQQLI